MGIFSSLKDKLEFPTLKVGDSVLLKDDNWDGKTCGFSSPIEGVRLRTQLPYEVYYVGEKGDVFLSAGALVFLVSRTVIESATTSENVDVPR
jgi:hypothetical protein